MEALSTLFGEAAIRMMAMRSARVVWSAASTSARSRVSLMSNRPYQ
jgi:hypothetical protein